MWPQELNLSVWMKAKMVVRSNTIQLYETLYSVDHIRRNEKMEWTISMRKGTALRNLSRRSEVLAPGSLLVVGME